MQLKQSVKAFVNEKFDYFNTWILDEPIFVDYNLNESLHALQKVMHKVITEFVVNYFDKYSTIMPVSDGVQQVLKAYCHIPYKAGTYRTDFILDEKDKIKLIEITCRFALNGMFTGALMDEKGRQYKEDHKVQANLINPYENIFEEFAKLFGDKKRVIILRGEDLRNESKHYISILERIGLDVVPVNHSDFGEFSNDLQDTLIINELDFDEVLALPKSQLQAIISSDHINDFRTVFLIHDKRFFNVLLSKDLQKNCLTEDEIALLENFTIPTHNYGATSKVWQAAKTNKDAWILKHRSLGKSKEIYAGCLTSAQEWEALFESEQISDMILQKWINQKTYKSTLKGKEVNDYITGTLLFFNDNYFGFGEFRTSSYPITNKVDHRKAAGYITNDLNVLQNPKIVLR